MIVKCDPRHGKYMASWFMYRRDEAAEMSANASLVTIKTKHTIQILDPSQSGFTCGRNYQPSTVVPDGECD